MMTHYIKPSHLSIGDTVGIVSPSSTINVFPRRLLRGIESLEKLSLRVVIAKNAKKSFGHNAGTPEERADDIHAMFVDPSVKAIICSTGGLNANAVLPLLDYDLMRRNPKIFCGYSDITVLNNAILHKARLITFNGPTVLPTFGEYGGIHEFTADYFKKALFSNKPIGTLESARESTDENLWWETEDSRPSQLAAVQPMRAVNYGNAEGILMGGNLNTLCMLGGTEFMPDFTDAILFLEDEGEGTAYTERRLFYLEQIGIFKRIRGIIFGRPYQFSTDSQERTLDDILLFFGEKYGIPIVADVDFGHTTPMITLPLGVQARVRADQMDVEVSVVESGTV
ncbi:MAG: S66 peptidase family protein [Minisyncoccota bacterium]